MAGQCSNMTTISQLCDTIVISGVTPVTITAVNCFRVDGTSYDYILLQSYTTGIGLAPFTNKFLGSLTRNTGLSATYFTTVCGWDVQDPARALITGFAGPASYTIVVPVTFKWFYPVCTVFGAGPGAMNVDIFGF